VVDGEIIRFGKQLRVSFNLHDTVTGGQLTSGRAGAETVDDLERPVEEAAANLFAAIYTPPTPTPTPPPPPVPTPWSTPVPTPKPATPTQPSSFSPQPSSDGMVLVPGGTFMMGCSPGDTECDSDEKPAHSETVSLFYMDATEVTQAQYRQAMGTNPSHFSGCENCPVESVDWNQARDYCSRVGKRLPTEAEWEYAARGGTTGARYGDLDAIAWYSKNSGSKTHPVGQKQPNAYGLYDMLGNVYEWTSDGWSDNYNASRSADRRVVRGGSWGSTPRTVRASGRGGGDPSNRFNYVGFRCSRDGN
jgi:formylglycine-generating enzyme required for sulfatase activity